MQEFCNHRCMYSSNNNTVYDGQNAGVFYEWCVRQKIRNKGHVFFVTINVFGKL